MKRRNFLLHLLSLLYFMAAAVPSYGYNEQFVVDGIRYFHLGYERCQAIGLTDTTEVVRIPDVVYDEDHPYRVTEINFGTGLPLRNSVVYCPYWLEYIWPESFRHKDLIAIYFQENEYPYQVSLLYSLLFQNHHLPLNILCSFDYNCNYNTLI